MKPTEIKLKSLQKVIYIASVGYSGSTLLDMLLGSQENITALGEVALLARYANENAKCTCGSPVRECQFWKRIEEKLNYRSEKRIVLSSYNLTPEIVSQTIFRKLPTISDVALILGNKNFWQVACRISKSANGYREASRNAVNLFDTVCESEGTTHIVDSSKYALPLKSLYMELKDKVKVIYLVRDGRAVSKSLMRRQGLSMEQAVKKWVRFNNNIQIINRTIPDEQVYFLSYERLCLETESVFDELTDFLGIIPPIKTRKLNKEEFHDIGGNPMRFDRESIEVKYDDSWREKITEEELEIFNRFGSRMNKKLGYSNEA